MFTAVLTCAIVDTVHAASTALGRTKWSDSLSKQGPGNRPLFVFMPDSGCGGGGCCSTFRRCMSQAIMISIKTD